MAIKLRREMLRFSVELLGLSDRLEDRAFSAEDVVHGKPAPDRLAWAEVS
jgi:hypothetical protein